MNILITGVAGLLGSRLADWIIENTDNNVIGIDDLSGGYKENINDKWIFYKKSINDDIPNILLVPHPSDYNYVKKYSRDSIKMPHQLVKEDANINTYLKLEIKFLINKKIDFVKKK